MYVFICQCLRENNFVVGGFLVYRSPLGTTLSPLVFPNKSIALDQFMSCLSAIADSSCNNFSTIFCKTIYRSYYSSLYFYDLY